MSKRRDKKNDLRSTWQFDDGTLAQRWQAVREELKDEDAIDRPLLPDSILPDSTAPREGHLKDGEESLGSEGLIQPASVPTAGICPSDPPVLSFDSQEVGSQGDAALSAGAASRGACVGKSAADRPASGLFSDSGPSGTTHRTTADPSGGSREPGAGTSGGDAGDSKGRQRCHTFGSGQSDSPSKDPLAALSDRSVVFR
jgi:hypothetical protein